MRHQLGRFRGELLGADGAVTRAAFDGPARAVRCARAIAEAAAARGIALRAGLHTGECLLADWRAEGPAVTLSAAIAELAQRGEVLVSATVRDLLGGSGVGLRERDGTGPDGLRLFAAGAA